LPKPIVRVPQETATLAVVVPEGIVRVPVKAKMISTTNHLIAVKTPDVKLPPPPQIQVPPQQETQTGGTQKIAFKQGNTDHLRGVETTQPNGASGGKDLKTPTVGGAKEPKKPTPKGISTGNHFNAVGGINGPNNGGNKKPVVGPPTGEVAIPVNMKPVDNVSGRDHFGQVTKPVVPVLPLKPTPGGKPKPGVKPKPGGMFGKHGNTGHFGALTGKIPGQNPLLGGRQTPQHTVWVPTVATMRDYVDYLIYVSNKYTFFKDLCKKHSIIKAQADFKTDLLVDAEKGLYPRYTPKNRLAIKKFVVDAIDKILVQFTILYNDPGKTCSCFDILNRFEKLAKGQKDVVKKFSSVISDSCPNVIPVRPVPRGPSRGAKTPLKINKKAGRVDSHETVQEIDAEIMSME
jgi:hypothetical protein